MQIFSYFVRAFHYYLVHEKYVHKPYGSEIGTTNKTYQVVYI